MPLACIAPFCNGTGLTHVTKCKLDLSPYSVLVKWFGQFPTCTTVHGSPALQERNLSYILLCTPQHLAQSWTYTHWRKVTDLLKATRQRNQRSNCQHPLDHQKSKRVPEKHLLLLYRLHQSLWLCGSGQTVEILKEMGIPDHLTCLLRNLYAGQEATVRTGHGTTNWF